MSRARAFLELARPQQWAKNSFVLTGLLFGHAWQDPQLIAAAVAATVAFCLASSAVYAFNDAGDAARDRRHAQKRTRPVASGVLSVREACVAAAVLGVASLAVAAAVSPLVAGIVAAYLALNVAYTHGLKHVPVVDVFIIAAGFMLRLLAGTAGIGIEPSNWLLLCGLLLTLMLGFGKRRAELEELADEAGEHRAVLEDYSVGFLDKAVLVCAGGVIVCYALYTMAPETAALHGTERLVLTLPWVLLGTFRYLFRLNYRGGGGDPTDELLRDPVLALATLGWAATVFWLIG
ncbi:MAG: prenyltransferase [Betaproteobacteria bacterium RIFCSPLOWO2_02_FULL_67_19]|nr:MAG: prenyltransferase [Betaproteobacteria bacterium RIFCSPLOWO2_02_FULL_67_19]